MSTELDTLLRASLKASVAIIPLAIVLLPVPALAQSGSGTAQPTTTQPIQIQPTVVEEGAEEDARDAEDERNIVVTGTSIRGIAPTGANSIAVGEEEIAATGATSVSQVLATIPQLGAGGGLGNYFNAIPQPDPINQLSASGTEQTQQRPQLRPTPASTGDAGNSTLVLIDGNRLAGGGVNSNAASGDSVPPGILERVELNTDGASAVYGSDAISGVINFVTRRRFDGIQVGARYGFAPNYYTWDVNGIVGKDWGSGSAYVAYSRSYADKLFNRDRDYVNPIDFGTGLERDLNCDTENIRVNANTAGSTNPLVHFYATTATGVNPAQFTVVAPLIGTANVCRSDRDATLAAEAKRENVFASITQEFGPLRVTVRGHYNYNYSESNRQAATYTATINNTNPFWRPLPGEPNVTSYSVLGSYADAFGRESMIYTNSTRRIGGSAEVAWDISSDWQVRATGLYDTSDSDLFIREITAANQNAAFNTNATTACSVQRTAAACLNPFDIASSNAALLAGIFTSARYGEGHDRVLDFKVVADGPIFELPGGEVRVAIGAEYYWNKFSRGNFSGLEANINNAPTAVPPGLNTPSETLDTKSIFGEINIPFVSESNARPLLHEFKVAASGRYDKYARFGGTFNPRVGFSYKPFVFLKIRGNWNTSFRAPSTLDLLGMGFSNSTVTDFAATTSNGRDQIFVDPTRPIPASMGGPTGGLARTIVLQGTSPNLGPQTGEGYSIALEFTPIPRLFASLNYYRTDYKGTFARPCGSIPCFPLTPQLATVFPTPAQIAAFKLLGVGGTNITVPDNLVYSLVDGRKINQGNAFIRGVDYVLRYSVPTGFGSVFGSLSGNVQLDNKAQPVPGLAFIDQFVSFPQPKHKMSVQLGATGGGFRGTVTLQHSGPYRVLPSAIIFQSRVSPYNVFNLAASYNFQGDSLIERDLELSVTINNLFDNDPPILRQTGRNGYANGSTLGRVVILGISKKI